MPKLLHVADVHLGAKFTVLGERGREQRAQLQETFSRTLRIAADESLDAVLIAGDLFDSQQVDRSLVEFAAAELRALADRGVRVYLIAGSHDHLGEASVYRRFRFAQLAPNAILFDEQTTSHAVPELGLTVFGRSLPSSAGPRSPLAGLVQGRATRFGVGLVHGSLLIPERTDPLRWPITVSEIEESGLDYLALGDWHSLYCVPSRTPAWYAGAPEFVSLDQDGFGHAVVVALAEDGPPQVEARWVARRRLRREALDFGLLGSGEALRRRLAAAADPDLILDVTLTGLTSGEDRPDLDALQEELGPQFFRLRITDRLVARLDDVRPEAFPEYTVLGQFVRVMHRRLAEAPEDAREVVREALHVGVAMLRGGKVL